jgi:sulfoxide reductase heme-binding subunit YedZ
VTHPDALHYGWWIAARASGLVALALITLSVGIGLTMAGGVSRRPGLKRSLMAVHEHAAVIAFVAICVHGLTLLADQWLRPGVVGITVPFTMSYRPLFSGLGVIAAYLSALLGLSFYARRRIGAKLWRKLHRFTVVAYVLAVVHTLGAGTDAQTPWLRTAMLVTGAPILFLFLRRVLPKGRAQERPAARRPVGESRQPATQLAQEVSQ